MDTPIYNNIGTSYDSTRKADPYIAGRMLELLDAKSGGSYLDVGCGTGNYIAYFSQLGYFFAGIDPSDIMLDKARVKCPNITFIKAGAESIPFDDNSFDGASGMFTLHHWKDIQQGLKELYRVLKPQSKLVFLSFTSEQTDGYWLAHYFPEMIKRAGEIPDQHEMFDLLHRAGFSSIETEKYFVHEGLQDQFMYSNKFKPEQYLNPDVRKGISTFAIMSGSNELNNGLQQLEADIATGKINDIIRSYENDNGDYLFYVATKP